MEGVAFRFAREDAVEQAWRIVDPVLDANGPVYRYERGSWGPAEAAKLLAHYGGWHAPGEHVA
jgi:glucose-6-phosphate 1-dehydrogenase